ncbi:hypothetical protein ESCO_001668 [Escovopsis weberi]|uniref:Protein ECM13 n=1 Tax=Escovopsis weberi TaxID=150374 RepID=A0A0M8MZH5_ESCWE|nr:hypothetical protein ESCO_001668 [Escovopsis weberi]
MSITQTYYLAHKARAKLSREAAQPDHDLRLLVGHANLLDSLMLELAEAEREQESWFNQSVRRADQVKRGPPPTSSRHIQWVDQVVDDAIDSDEEDEEEVEYDSDTSESDSEYEEEANSIKHLHHHHINGSVSSLVSSRTHGEDADHHDDLEEDYAHLSLVRTSSRGSSPPELVDHDSESSDEEAMPPSPADAQIIILEKEVGLSDQEDSLFEEEFYQPTPAGLVSAIPVY